MQPTERHSIGAINWYVAIRVVIKASVLFGVINAVCILTNPMPLLGQVSGYNLLFAGRERLPYGEDPTQSYNLSLNNLNAMFASHIISQPKRDDEFRVALIGDSSTWGFLLETEDTLANQLNNDQLQTPDGRQMQFYNLGYPTMSLSKDLLILDKAMGYDLDLVVWLFTLQSFRTTEQLSTPLVANNPDAMQRLVSTYALNLDYDRQTFESLTITERTIFGRRRALADLLRLQVYGVMWATTGIDQAIPASYMPTPFDLTDERVWKGLLPATFVASALSVDVLAAGVQRADSVPVLLVNEPMFIGEGENGHVRYNSFFPRWVYNSYRALLMDQAQRQGWYYVDLWNQVEAETFTDSPVHMNPVGVAQLATALTPHVETVMSGGELPAFPVKTWLGR